MSNPGVKKPSSHSIKGDCKVSKHHNKLIVVGSVVIMMEKLARNDNRNCNKEDDTKLDKRYLEECIELSGDLRAEYSYSLSLPYNGESHLTREEAFFRVILADEAGGRWDMFFH